MSKATFTARLPRPPCQSAEDLQNIYTCGLLSDSKRSTAQSSDIVFAYSARDLKRYREILPKVNWAVTRNGADVRGITPADQPKDRSILLVASWSYHPNRVGLFWFLDEVLPKLHPHESRSLAQALMRASKRNSRRPECDSRTPRRIFVLSTTSMP